MEIPIKTVAGVFPSLAEAERAAHDLENFGVPPDSVSVIAGNDTNRHEEYLKKAKRLTETTAGAAASGASIGGGAGLIATLIALAVPGVGVYVLGGALAAVLAGLVVGAAGGGVLAALAHMGVAREEAPLYEEAVRRGAVILVANVNDAMEKDAFAIMQRHGSRDVREQVTEPDPHPYPWIDTIRSAEPSEIVDIPETRSK